MPKVLTHKGFKSYQGLSKEYSTEKKVEIITSDDNTITTTLDHNFITREGEIISADSLQINDILYNNHSIKEKRVIEKNSFVYDLLEVEDTHAYTANNIVVKNCIFLDEFAFVQHSLAEDFFRATYPVISSGMSTKVIIVSCVTKDTFVFTNKGLKQVIDFIDDRKESNPTVGYEVDDYSILGARDVNHGHIMVNSGVAPTKVIRTKSSMLECSLNHKLFACKNGVYDWFRADKLSPEDYIMIHYGENVWGNNDDISDFTPYSNEKRYHKSFTPPESITGDIAYLLGLYLAEGYTDEKNNKTVITSNDDIGYAFDNLNLEYQIYDGIHYSFTNKAFTHFLKYMGFDISLKAKDKRIPGRILECSRDVIAQFLSGFFDGDGCATNRGKINVISASEILIKQIRFLLMNLGILTQYYTGTTPPTKRVSVESVYHRLEVSSYDHAKVFYDEIGFKLSQKNGRANLLKKPLKNITKDLIPFGRLLLKLNGIELKEDWTYKRTPHISRKTCLGIDGIDKLKHIIHKNITWEKIKEIGDSENEVFDFSLDHIEGDDWCHSVAYNGIIGHQTPNGLNMFYKMWVDAMEKRSLYIPYEIHWSQVPGRDQKWMEETIRNTSQEAFEVEYNCEFIGSTATLVSGAKLRSLAFRKPILSEDAFDIYIQPERDHQYVCVVDCSEGVQQDYSTVSVIDVTTTPYVQVAKYRDNKTPLLFLPNTIYSIAKKYNEAFVLVETNNIGQQVIDILHYELEYENIYKVDQHHIKGQSISAGYKRNSSIGIRTTKTVKKIGCANLKTLIETDKLILYDFDTIAELNSFIRVRDSYAAEDGAHDDLVMGLVLFSWLTAQTYFKDATNTDIRKLLIEEHNISLDESVTPVGFIDNGLGDDHYYDGQDIWYFNLPDT